MERTALLWVIRRGSFFDYTFQPAFSPDGRTVAYGARDGQHEFVVVGDKKGEEFAGVSNPTFSPDGKTVAYAAWEDRRNFIIAGDKRGEDFDHVEPPIFSPDGKKLAFYAVRGKEIWWKVMKLE